MIAHIIQRNEWLRQIALILILSKEKDMAPHQSAHPTSSGQKTMSIRVHSF